MSNVKNENHANIPAVTIENACATVIVSRAEIKALDNLLDLVDSEIERLGDDVHEITKNDWTERRRTYTLHRDDMRKELDGLVAVIREKTC